MQEPSFLSLSFQNQTGLLLNGRMAIAPIGLEGEQDNYSSDELEKLNELEQHLLSFRTKSNRLDHGTPYAYFRKDDQGGWQYATYRLHEERSDWQDAKTLDVAIMAVKEVFPAERGIIELRSGDLSLLDPQKAEEFTKKLADVLGVPQDQVQLLELIPAPPAP